MEERFQELAMLKLAGRASDEESRELDGLLADNPEFKAEFELLQKEIPAIKELVPMAKTPETSDEEVPEYERTAFLTDIEEIFGKQEQATPAASVEVSEAAPTGTWKWALGMVAVVALIFVAIPKKEVTRRVDQIPKKEIPKKEIPKKEIPKTEVARRAGPLKEHFEQLVKQEVARRAGPLKEHFEQLVKRGGGFMTDTTAKEGTFMLSVAAVALDSKVQNPNKLLEMARLIAQRDLSVVLETEFDAKEKLDSRLTTVTVDEKQKLAVKEFIASVIMVKEEEALRAAEILKVRSFAGQLYVGFLLSEKRMKAIVHNDNMVSGVVASGLAMVDKSRGRRGEAEARVRALANAQRNAVGQALGAVVQSDSQLRDYGDGLRISTSSQVWRNMGSLTKQRIIFEGREGSIYKVKIVATVSRKISLEKIVAAWTSSSGPSFWIDPGKNSDNPGQDLLESFSENFGKLGFRLLASDDEYADNWKFADYHITLDSRMVDRTNPSNGQPLTQMRMTVVIKDRKLGVEILRLKNDASMSTSVRADPISRKLECARKAFKQMAPELKKRIGKLVMDQLQNGREIQVVFSGAENLNGEGYDYVSSLIEWMPGVQNFRRLGHPVRREVRYKFRYRGDLNLLQATLTSEMMKRWPNSYPVLKTISANEVVFKFR